MDWVFNPCEIGYITTSTLSIVLYHTILRFLQRVKKELRKFSYLASQRDIVPVYRLQVTLFAMRKSSYIDKNPRGNWFRTTGDRNYRMIEMRRGKVRQGEARRGLGRS